MKDGGRVSFRSLSKVSRSLLPKGSLAMRRRHTKYDGFDPAMGGGNTEQLP